MLRIWSASNAPGWVLGEDRERGFAGWDCACRNLRRCWPEPKRPLGQIAKAVGRHAALAGSRGADIGMLLPRSAPIPCRAAHLRGGEHSTLKEVERDYILRVFRETGGVVSATAARLGMRGQH